MAEIQFAAYCADKGDTTADDAPIIANDALIIHTYAQLRKQVDQQRELLNAAKTSLDEAFKRSHFDTYWREFDPFKQEKYIISKMLSYPQSHITNAWLKCYEMLIWVSELHSFPNTVRHFDNAAFPGAFILAANHFFKTRRSGGTFEWVASSLIEKNSDDSKPLEDTYGLYARYKKSWLMTEKNNGDVMSAANLEDWHQRLGGTIDLYTSDLGFDVSGSYNSQETLQSRANYAQILAGILTLKPGGVMITKQYTIFEDATITCLYMLSRIFRAFYICKPATSRQANSETYIIGIGLSDDAKEVKAVTSRLYEAIAHEKKEEAFLFCDTAKIPPDFLQLIAASMEIYRRQVQKITHDRDGALRIRKIPYKGKPSRHPEILKFHKSIDEDVVAWYRRNQFLPLRDADRL